MTARSILRQLRAPATLVCVALLAPACVGRSDPEFWMEGKRYQNIRLAAERYGNDLRWGRITQAAAQVHKDDRSAFLAHFLDPRPPFTFTSFQLISVEQPESDEEAEVWVVYEYYRPPSVEERRLQELQRWTFDPRLGAWQVRPQLEVFSGPDSSLGALER